MNRLSLRLARVRLTRFTHLFHFAGMNIHRQFMDALWRLFTQASGALRLAPITDVVGQRVVVC